MLYGWKENSMLTNSLVARIERDIGRISSFFHTPLHSTPPLRGFPSEHRHPVWRAKTRMAWLDGEKISKIALFVLAQLTNVTEGQTDGHRVTAYTACIASRGNKMPFCCLWRDVETSCHKHFVLVSRHQQTPPLTTNDKCHKVQDRGPATSC